MAGREFSVARLIERVADPDLLSECFVPQYEVQKCFQGVWRTCTEVLFPGYLIVASDRIDELQALLGGVPEFARVLGASGRFEPLQPHEMAWIDGFTEKGHRVIGASEGVIEGDEIVISKGPLMNHTGWIRKINRRKRMAFLEIDMFGRTIQTKIGLSIVRKRT